MKLIVPKSFEGENMGAGNMFFTYYFIAYTLASKKSVASLKKNVLILSMKPNIVAAKVKNTLGL